MAGMNQLSGNYEVISVKVVTSNNRKYSSINLFINSDALRYAQNALHFAPTMHCDIAPTMHCDMLKIQNGAAIVEKLNCKKCSDNEDR